MLYLFAGADRRTSIKAVLQRFSRQFATVCEVEVEEWDICRGPGYDLLREDVQSSLMERIQRGEFCAIVMPPPCASWSRAPWANRWGPRPLRTAVYPWGMPWLEGWRLEKVANSNTMIKLCIRVIQKIQTSPQVAFLLEHPENLGGIRSRPSFTVRPASIWELDEVQALAQGRGFTRAFHQCKFGAISQKPTRILTDLKGLKDIGYHSWPTLNKQGLYLGPVPTHCTCGKSHSGIIKRGAEEQFSTTKAAAYPEAMDLTIALALWHHAQETSTPFTAPIGGESRREKGPKQPLQKDPAEQQGKKLAKLVQQVQVHQTIGENEEERLESGAKGIEGEEITAEEIEDLLRRSEKMAVAERENAEVVREERRATPGPKKGPLKVHYKGRVRNVCDGLGKCSPGIRPAGFRGDLGSGSAKVLQEAFWREVEELSDSLGKKGRLELISKLALGRFDSSPFEKDIEARRHRMDEILERLGYKPHRRKSDRTTAINFRRVRAFAQVVGDEDSAFLEGLVSTGVPLGVRGEIPHVAEVYDRKEKGEKEEGESGWDKDDDPEPRSNYGSATAHMDKVQAIVEEEERKGWIKKVSLEEAKRMYGSDVQVASLGAVPKDPSWEEIRVVHDGTHGISVNTEIRQPNRMTFPQCDDVEAMAEALRRIEVKEKMLFAFDIKAAQVDPCPEGGLGSTEFSVKRGGRALRQHGGHLRSCLSSLLVGKGSSRGVSGFPQGYPWPAALLSAALRRRWSADGSWPGISQSGGGFVPLHGLA